MRSCEDTKRRQHYLIRQSSDPDASRVRRRLLSIITVLPFFPKVSTFQLLTVLMSDLKGRRQGCHARGSFCPENCARFPEADLIAVAQQCLSVWLPPLGAVEKRPIAPLQVLDNEAPLPPRDEGMATGNKPIRVNASQVDVR